MDFWADFEYESFIVYKILQKHYEVEVVDDPQESDYIICSCFYPKLQYIYYPKVRIMYSEENYTPDFNLIDYSICSYPIDFYDRNLYYPHFGRPERFLSLGKERRFSKEILKSKPYFANFVSSHESEHGLRGEFFKQLCNYRRVESAGSYLNNMPDGYKAYYKTNKIEFQKKSKFTLCFEATAHKGFITEKIIDAFCAETIPIYFGSDNIKEIYNPKAFINVPDFPDFDSAIEYIKKIDQDDDLYLKMLNEPIFVEENYVENEMKKLESFLLNIFDQPLEKAYRRPRAYTGYALEQYLRKVVLPNDLSIMETLQILKDKIRKKYIQKK